MHRVGTLLLAVTLAACGGRGAGTIERLRTAVDDYVQGKPEPSEQQLDALFAQVDADIAALRARAAAAVGAERAATEERAKALTQERLSLWQTYMKARIERLRRVAEQTVREAGKQIGQEIEEAGRAIREAMEQKAEPQAESP